MQNQFNTYSNQFQLPSLKDYLKYMSSSQAMATKGQGVDYTTNPSIFVVGASLGVGVDIGSQTLSSVQESMKKSGSIPSFGFGYQVAAMVGFNLGFLKTLPSLGPIDLKRLSLYTSFGGYNFSDVIKQDGVTVKSFQLGFHAKYKVIEHKTLAFGVLNWTGLDFVTGFTVASNTLGYAKNFDTQTTGSGTVSDPRISGTPSGTVTVNNRAFAVPFELVTGVRLLYILSLYGGAGIDLNFGTTDIDIAISSNLTSTVTGAGTYNAGTLRIAANDKAAGRFGDLRFIVGGAINLVPLKSTNVLSLVAQGNISVGGGYGIMLGVRAGW